MLTLEEAIKHCIELAEKNEEECKNWTFTQDEYKELIEKLEGHDEELKKQYERGFKDGIKYGVTHTELD